MRFILPPGREHLLIADQMSATESVRYSEVLLYYDMVSAYERVNNSLCS